MNVCGIGLSWLGQGQCFFVFLKHYKLLRYRRAGNIMVMLNAFHSVVLRKIYLHNTIKHNHFN